MGITRCGSVEDEYRVVLSLKLRKVQYLVAVLPISKELNDMADLFKELLSGQALYSTSNIFDWLFVLFIVICDRNNACL